MPLARYQIRNEYGLADPELYKAAERDDPEALLEGVAMAGLVGVLRQLGDLAEFAAEIFHDLHEEVMATAARGHGLVARVQQLETDFPSIEKAFLSQTSHSPFFSAPGIDWHPNLRSEQNLVTRGDLPRFVMDSYEECRGPPRLFLLDKYDVAGAGACLKRYTDPSFFKVEAKSNEVPTGDVHREKKVRKMKKKAARVRNGETSGAGPASHAKLHQLLMKERIENGYSDSARAVKLKKRHLNGYPFDAETGKSYMVQFVETPSPEHKVVHEVPASPPRLKFRSYNRTSKTEKDASEMLPPRNERSCSPPYDPEPEILYRPSIDDVKEVVDRSSEVVPVLSSDGETDEIPSSPPEVMDKTMYAVGGKGGKEGSVDGYLSDDVASEVDNYMDALTTMESEMETDNEHRVKNDLGFLNFEKHGMDSDAYEEQLEFQTVLAGSQSIANSSSSANENGSLKKGISSISYSDTTSNSAENTPSDGDEADKVLPSNKPCIADAPSGKLSTNEILESKSDELEVPNNMHIEEFKIPDPRGTSPSNKLSTSEIVEPKSDRLEGPKDTFIEEVMITDTRATSCVSAELVETQISDRTQFGTISSDAVGTEIILAESNDVFSSIPSQNGDHILFAVPDETNDVNKFDDGGLGVTSDASPHLSNISEGVREKRGSEYSGSEGQAIDADRYLAENFDGGEIGSAYSVSPADEQQLCSALPEVETSSVIKPVPAIIPASIASYSDSLKLEDIVTEVDHAIPSTEANLEKLAPMVDASESRKSTEEQLSGIPDDVSELDRDLDERSDTVDGQETGMHRCSAEDEEREVDPREDPCNLYNYTDHEDCGNLGDMITETVQAVDAALSFASAASPDDGIIDVISSSSDIVSSPGNLVSFHEFLSDFGGQHQGGLEFNEEISPGCLVEPEVKQEATQLEFALIDSDSAPKNSASYTEDVSVTEQDHTSSHVGDVATTSLISQPRTQVPEPISPQPDDLLENSEDASPSSTSLQEMGVPSQQFSRFQIDEVHIENFKVDEEQLQSPIYQDRELPFDVSKSSPEDQATISELSPQSADLELDFAGKAIDLSDPIPSLTEVVPGNHASPASGSEDLPYQSSPPEFLPQSSIHEGDRTKQAIGITDSSLPNFGMHSVATQVSHSAVDGLDSSPPFFGSFPESTPDHLEMPPLPPLPPMQWRMGKVHNAPFPSLGGSFQFGQASCNTALSSADDEKAKSGFLSDREILQPQNPFVPHTAVEDERSQHNYMVNDLAGEGRQSQDSFSTFPMISDDRETHAFHTPGGEISQSSYIPLPLQVVGDSISRHDPVSSQGNLMQPLNQSTTETAADAETIQHICKDLEGQGDTSPNTFAPPQSLEDEQAQNGLTRGEIAWYSKASAFVPFEAPKPNGNSTVKIPRPRSPLIDAVAAHDKSTLRKVTERSRPQIEPKADERDSLLEQIRMKSFNLKPAVVTRPSIQGPKTNLKVAAILEKANAIRQALAGSDDEDDGDSWSDS